ncbi:TIGR02678 family protein [Amycolatopsis balhimycina DSM 5908]|uniref:TIGR02678 family protein n=1 Tax=Amycolatopsis balhimycina DSM 5908 TaxID=1081091 RepID=A0A428WR46_AMYBA|nr:TIGR02678 family protein [Amycolatopsis balhimycina]RSM45498.1 TIGR02678 family protein [Amycolatopsis balhimycina DSM 5908]
MSSLADALSVSRADEFRRAARALLRRPIIRAAGQGSDDFTLIRRHTSELRAWFDRNTGWRLTVDSEVARLVKTVATTADHTHPARDVRSKQPFGRRRYVLLCLALATLERADAQITLGRLAEQVVLAAADPELTGAGITFTLQGREERTDLVSVVRLLLDLGVLSRVSGDEDAFVKDTGDVLYDVERRVLAGLLAAPRGPSTVQATAFEDRLAALTAELSPTTDELRNQRIRQQLTRRLLDEPVLYYDELTEAEFAYLNSQRGAITARIVELTGLKAEVRAEGIAMVDPADDLTDVRMPETGTEGHATLLLAEYLASSTGRAVLLTELHAKIREFAAENRSYWRRNSAEPGAETELTAAALVRLEALRLITMTAETVTARPALSRYALAEPTIQERR